MTRRDGHLPGFQLRQQLVRLLTVFLATLGTMSIAAPMAAADGVGPTNYRSVVSRVEPAHDTVTVEVLGSDSFLQVTARPGTRVDIPGYESEPYLRIDADGSVWRNRNSPASYVNLSRTGTTSATRDLPDASNPDWQRIGSGGSVAWHDHRIHWMSNTVPTTRQDGLVSNWEVPLTIDGVDVVAHGSLYRRGNVFPWPVLVTVAVAVATLALLGRWARRSTLGQSRPRPGPRSAVASAVLPGALLAAASVAALGVTLMVTSVDPPGAGTSPIPLVLAGLALLLATGEVAISVATRLGSTMLRLGAVLGSAALLAGWLVPLVGVFWMPYIPAVAPGAVVAVIVALIVGVVVGVVVSVLMNPALVVAPQGNGVPAD